MSTPAFQFASVEAYAVTASKLAKPDTKTVEGVTGELNRVPKYSGHVMKPRPPVYVAGSTAGLVEQLAEPVLLPGGRKQRCDSLVLLGGVFSHSDRWDKCDPVDVTKWMEDVVRFCGELWPGHVAAVVLHTDEGHPHLHVLVHADGLSVKSLHPGFAAGDLAYERARESGLSRHEANKIRKKEHKRAMEAFLDHYHQKVGVRYGWLRKSEDPRKRFNRQWAMRAQRFANEKDPIDFRRAEMNKDRVAVTAKSITAGLAGAATEPQSVLDIIGFVPRIDFKKGAGGGEQPDVAKTTNRTALLLQEKLTRILAMRPTFPEFIRLCKGEKIEILPRLEDGKVKGISYGLDGRYISGSKLGKRFQWPSIARSLSFDPGNREHVALIDQTLLSALASIRHHHCVIERIEPAANPARSKHRTLPLSVTRVLKHQNRGGAIHFSWRSSSTLAIVQTATKITVVKPVPDAIIVAIKVAVKAGWKAVRITLPEKVAEEILGRLKRLANRLRIRLELMSTIMPRPNGGGGRTLPGLAQVSGANEKNGKKSPAPPSNSNRPDQQPRTGSGRPDDVRVVRHLGDAHAEEEAAIPKGVPAVNPLGAAEGIHPIPAGKRMLGIAAETNKAKEGAPAPNDALQENGNETESEAAAEIESEYRRAARQLARGGRLPRPR
jgi:hypothetical protein